MKLRRCSEDMIDACAEFWWKLYGTRPYVIRPDGYQAVNAPPVGSETFRARLRNALSGHFSNHWQGEVTPESIILAEDEGKLGGVLICSIDRQNLVGNIRSGFVQRDQKGREIADLLVGEALDYFRERGLSKAVFGPSGSLEVESPTHAAALAAGFAWAENWEQWDDEAGSARIRAYPGYEVFFGGPLGGFRLRPEIEARVEALKTQGVKFRRCAVEELQGLKRFDTRQQPGGLKLDTVVTFAALDSGLLVGWLGHVGNCVEEAGVMARVCGLYVIPGYRRRGIGKVLYHLAIHEMVRRGAEYGYECAGICSPERLILRSVGYDCWYLGFGRMARTLT